MVDSATEFSREISSLIHGVGSTLGAIAIYEVGALFRVSLFFGRAIVGLRKHARQSGLVPDFRIPACRLRSRCFNRSRASDLTRRQSWRHEMAESS
jgi:hypothetical protein